jgi:hypothetical protein
MFALTSSMAYYLCPHDVDMRKGIYSLYQLVKSDMGKKPLVRRSFSVFWQKQGDDKDTALAKRRIYSLHKKIRKRHF